MKNIIRKPISASPRKLGSGFSLLELMVAVGVFLVVGAAAVSLINKHVPLFNAQQNQTTVNVGLRNAVAQMQIDGVNAGSGFINMGNIKPFGVTIANTTGGNCYDPATFTYGQNCFDELHITSVDTSTPPATPISATSCVSKTSTTLDVLPSDSTPLATLAADFHNGDNILLITLDLSGDITQMAMVALSADGMVSGGKVHLAHNPTATVEANNLINQDANPLNKLQANYCKPNSYVLKLKPDTIYAVDASNPANPVLYRQVGTGPKDTIADQIIAFKVGAMTWNGASADTYSFSALAAPPAGYNGDWASIRSVMVSLIGRTTPDQRNSFRNAFDGGPYKIQPVSVVINPRNLSMNDL